MTVDRTGFRHHNVLISGGGNVGLSVAGRLRRYGAKAKDIAVIEPREDHLYQPMFSNVAGGTAPAHVAVRPQVSVIPKGVSWIKASVEAVGPVAKTVSISSGGSISYGQLVVCPGIQKGWGAVRGLSDAMQSPTGVSNYEFEYAQKASNVLRGVHGGTVIFTQPSGPATCAGASQKPMYLACDFWRQSGVLEKIRVVLVVPTPTLFCMPLIDRELERNVVEYGIEVHYGSELVEVDAQTKSIVIADAPIQNGPDRGQDGDSLAPRNRLTTMFCMRYHHSPRLTG